MLEATVQRDPSVKIVHKYESAIYEVVETERLYVADLDSIVEHYKPFFDHFDEKSILNLLRQSLVNLKDFSHSIYEIFNKSNKDIRAIIGVFVDRWQDFEKYYMDYCDLFALANTLLQNFQPNSETTALMNKCKLDSKHPLPLSTYLLKPVQRILKYHLLLKESIARMKAVGDSLNEHKRFQEGVSQLPQLRKRIINLKNPLKFGLVGPLLLQNDMIVNNRPRQVLLFERVLLICKLTEQDQLIVESAFSVLISVIQVREIVLKENLEGEPTAFVIARSIISKSQHLMKVSTSNN
ncbi:Pleckstrin y domain-containing family G member 3 [Thelohanellus kitauei]|uniref:Pleckstrin y domain-containing family G member 3 n=1 Tax=Thelohanellus kitauei TaxID=669202 RepID=A0A0C2NFL4_THEKT|nr:Pleckstrin y domain-containing family G member 3 [Thelohanellus kitauei]